ncbi:CAP domain-containing protein [Edaphobacillus lindanitolerans]|uniref:Cysteine-rich secretory protein family protein n=1 Tax=Edaphobacillus lindanitolerans TaxID=550447 RepID=A0A1U7PLV3_9BACI|nr:CAP domain-containing protein [Edaphobacillus lindanitolerans]SIT88636.1 Cysteine-rich secretory protein family protein [Edaphobacillus lindanitolerans]
MRRLLSLILLVVLIFLARPLWEGPVSRHVDLTFLDRIDTAISDFRDKPAVNEAIGKIGDGAESLYAKLEQSVKDDRARKRETDTETVDKPDLRTPDNAPVTVHNLAIGDSQDRVRDELGEPVRSTMNEYGTDWDTYHDAYHNFVMVSVDTKGRVNALYTNQDMIASKAGIQYGARKAEVRAAYGRPLDRIIKGRNAFLMQDNGEYDVYELGGSYVTFFYDVHQNDAVTAVQLIDKKLELNHNALYAEADPALKEGFERQLFDLTNAARVVHGEGVLDWDGRTAGTAVKHSEDMAQNDYFAHENLKGQSPFDRMAEDGIQFRGAGENLAYGQPSAVFAHEGLMNSLGHRKNILNEDYRLLGVGVAFNDEDQPYYTENFLYR